MKGRSSLCLFLLVVPLMVVGAKKGKKNNKSPPQWKSSSMPAMNKRFESVYEGNDLNLDCKAQAHPKPNIKWFKDGVELKDSLKTEVKKFNLVLKTLSTDMSGNYTCVVSNKHGQIDWTFHLDVQVKIWPLNIEGPNNITQMVGSNVAFRCRVLNDPQATIRWQKIHSNKNEDDSKPQADFLPDDVDSQVLKLDNIQKDDEAEYRCMAGNVWGLKHSSAWLTVIEPVIIPELPRPSEMDKNKYRNNNNINTNSVVESFDPSESDNVDADNSIYDGGYGPEGLDPSDYGLDLYFTTTRRPKNRNNNRKKNERKKDRKGKEKIHMEEGVTISTTAASDRVQPTTSVENFLKSTYPEIWHFEDNNDDYDEISDSRYNPVKTNKDESVEDVVTENTDSSKPDKDVYIEGSISSWTIYTIVGAVGGVILLIGLVAITLTLCCKKEDSSVYKSTPV